MPAKILPPATIIFATPGISGPKTDSPKNQNPKFFDSKIEKKAIID